jgi:photosystem II stability/assembly factor-like uncharacterized protein
MTTTLYIATDAGLAVVTGRGDGGRTEWALSGKVAQCVAVDPRRPERVYCGTFDAGLWCSGDAGRSWQPAGAGIPHPAVMSLAVGPEGTIWAGTEPSAIFHSDDGGRSWREEPALRELPSAPTWSFPPRPYTSHVRWIQLDPHDSGRVLASIEAGGVMRSEDGGATWDDRHPDTPRDAHGLAMHPDAPGRVYAASGDRSYAESADGGRTWRRLNEGLTYHYLWSVAVDPGDPDTVVVSGSPGAGHAHRSGHSESALFRKRGDAPWEQIAEGLPPAEGTMTYALATADGSFFAAPHQGDLYRSTDAGRSWAALGVAWPGGDERPYVQGLAAVVG